MRRIFMTKVSGSGEGVAPPTHPLGAQLSVPGRPISGSALVDLAVEVWRLQRKLRRAAIPEAVMAPLARSADRIAEALAEMQVEIRDPEGEPFREGMSWDVASFEPPGEVVRETLRPAVYLFGSLAILAQVIVGPRAADDTVVPQPDAAKGRDREQDNH